MLTNLVAGLIAVVIALVFLSILVYSVPSPALWIVVLVGFACMLANFIESVRGEDST